MLSRYWILLVWFFLPVTASAGAGTKLYPHLVRSTAWIRAGQQGMGTGWIVDEQQRWLVTNLHVVGDQDRVEAFFVVGDKEPDFPAESSEPQTGKDGWITRRSYYLEHQKLLHDRGRAVWGKVICRREKSDLALVELEKIPPDARSLALAAKSSEPADEVFSVGHRHDSEALWTLTVGSLRQKGQLADGYFWRSKPLARGATCWIVQSPINSGDSGSALVNCRGEVVAVLSGIRWQAPCAAIAIQSGEVAALLAEVRKKVTPKTEPVELNAHSIYPQLVAATGWVRPAATDRRTAGWIVDHKRRLMLTTSQGAGSFDLVDVIFPVREKKQAIVAEVAAYADLVDLRQSGQLVRGIVLARDLKRDLALIELDELPPGTGELGFAAKEPGPGETVQTVNHPLGVELLWLNSMGTVRQIAKVEFETSAKPVPLRTLLLQIPAQSASAGSAVVDERGDVVGLLAHKEGVQQQLGYALSALEIQPFIESARSCRQPESACDFRERSGWLRSRGQAERAIKMWHELGKSQDKLAQADIENLREEIEAHIDADQWQEALSIIEKTEIKLDPAAAANWQMQKAEVLARLGRQEDALRLCASLLKTNPKSARAYFVRALCHDTKEAITDLEEAIWNDPKMDKAYGRLGQILEEANQDEKALIAYGQALELNPYQATLIRHRAEIYLKQHDLKRAITEYDRLIELRPKQTSNYRALALAYWAKGEEDKALVPMRTALRWDQKMAAPLLKDLLQHAEFLRKQWPDNPVKTRKFLGDAIQTFQTEVKDGAVREKLGIILGEKDLEKQLEQLRRLNGR